VRLALVAAACLLLSSPFHAGGRSRADEITIGSKAFPESLVLGEMVAQLARQAGATADHGRTKGLGGTQVLWGALTQGTIDVYPEYTGTIAEEILAGQGLKGDDALRTALAARGVRMSRPLGFNNTYALGMKESAAAALGITAISDLRRHPDLKFAFSNEFLKRGDGWPGLRDRYGLPQRDVRGMQHELAYRALADGAVQVTELYSTDAEIRQHGLRVLRDDLGYFPPYQAVLLYRAELEERAPAAVAAFRRLEGAVSEPDMVALNARVKLEGVSPGQAAADFLAERLGTVAETGDEGFWGRLRRHTIEHLFLVGVSLAAAVAVAVPLGVLAARRPGLGQVLLATAGVLQTIPSLALLVFLIPLLKTGPAPAVAALFLYSLLPILRNTYAGLQDIPLPLRESAAALGLSPWAQLRLVELPLASRSILAGIKTAAVINVGTATLGGFIGAGGYGQPIFTGIPLNNLGLVLEGAVPAALLALAVQGGFELAERFLVPRGLRLKGGA
jgi:osmoprotectant transport system permease protein